jgi:hypothetical protein
MSARAGVLILGLSIGIAAAVACGDPPAAPTAIRTPPGSIQTVQSIRIEGDGNFTTVGESRQFTAIARYADGSEAPVTESVWWSAGDPDVLTTTGGLVVIRRLGTTTLTAGWRFGSNLHARMNIIATPAGTFASSGRIHEPGVGGKAGWRIAEVGTGVEDTTDSAGDFNLGGLTSGLLRVVMDGYEATDRQVKPGDPPLDFPVQPIVRMPAGSELPVMLTPYDGSYEMVPGTSCEPCRRIRLVSTMAGTVDVTITWDDPRSALTLWVAGRPRVAAPPNMTRIVTSVPVVPGETFVYLGGSIYENYMEIAVTANVVVSAVR